MFTPGVPVHVPMSPESTVIPAGTRRARLVVESPQVRALRHWRTSSLSTSVPTFGGRVADDHVTDRVVHGGTKEEACCPGDIQAGGRKIELQGDRPAWATEHWPIPARSLQPSWNAVTLAAPNGLDSGMSEVGSGVVRVIVGDRCRRQLRGQRAVRRHDDAAPRTSRRVDGCPAATEVDCDRFKRLQRTLPLTEGHVYEVLSSRGRYPSFSA